MEFLCIVCSKEVRRQQHAFQCDGCDKWQHRTCNTDKRHGVRKKRSYESQLILTFQDLSLSLEDGEQIDTVLLDSSKVANGSGAIEINFVKYDNPGGFKDGNLNQCCDGPWMSSFQCHADPCDPIFDICIQDISSHDCPLGRKITGYVDNRNTIHFQTTIGSNDTRNPVAFPVAAFYGNSVIVTITVFDEDLRAGNANNEKIDYLQQMVTFVPDFNGKRNTILNYTLQGAVSSLLIEVNVRCGTFFYGNDCTKKCRSDRSTYDCSSSGDRTCRPGWNGADCATNVDDCVNHMCQNGARCQDEVNNYTCVCMPGFTGRYCESIIATSTASTTTKSTTAQSTTTTPTPIPSTTTKSSATPSTTFSLDTTSMQPKLASSTLTTSDLLNMTVLSGSTEQTTSSSGIPTKTSTQPTVMSSTMDSTTLKTTELSPAIMSTERKSTSLTTLLAISPNSSLSSRVTLVSTNTSATSTTAAGTTISPCVISNIVTNVSSNYVTAIFNVRGTFDFKNFKQQLEHWLQDKIKVNTTITLTSQTILGTGREVTIASQVQTLLLDIEGMKHTIVTYCNPQASKYGKNKMPEPEASDGSPGPVIGGVFGALAVAAVGTVAGFFLYKRKFKQTPADVEDAKKNWTNGNDNKQDQMQSDDRTRDRGDGKSAEDVNIEDKRETKVYQENLNKGSEVPGEVDLSDLNKAVDF